MKQQSEEKHFLNRIKQQLDSAENTLPASIEGRLRAARRQAVTQKTAATGSGWMPLKPAAALVGVTLIAIVSLKLMWPEEQPLPLSAAMEDLPILTASEELEFYENLEFYLWLEVQDNG